MSNIKLFDVRHSNVQCQNDMNIILNAKLFDVRHSNVQCQNDMNIILNAKLFDVRHSNVEHQMTNVKPISQRKELLKVNIVSFLDVFLNSETKRVRLLLC